MTLADFNPAILLLLAVIGVAAAGAFIGAIRRSSSSRYDIRDDEWRRR